MSVNTETETALLMIVQQADAEFNLAMDAVIALANAAKNKTSIKVIGAKAILNSEPEPKPEPEPDPENYGPEPMEPMHYPDTSEKKENG